MSKFYESRRISVLAVLCLLVTPAGFALEQNVVTLSEPVAGLELMPYPGPYQLEPGNYLFPESVTVQIHGPRDERLVRAVYRWAETISTLSGVLFKVRLANTGEEASLNIAFDQSNPFPTIDTEESYEIHVTDSGVELTAKSNYGVILSLETLAQMVQPCESGLCAAYAEVRDSPRFRWWGLLLDTVRHWIPIDVLKRQLDAMAHVKLNVLHLHFSDDQSFRLESKRFPLLHQKGSDGRYYKQEQVRELVEYAADRGIRVVPEIGLPGHSRSWQIAYPKLAVDPELKRKLYSGKAFSLPIDPTRDEVYDFISELIKEMAGLFPDEYMHMGGDEVKTSGWTDNGSISAFIEQHGMEDVSDLLAYFSIRYAQILKRHGKTVIGWDEVLHPDLMEDVVIHLWRSTDVGKEVLDHPVLLSTNYYLDHVLRGQKGHPPPRFQKRAPL